MKTIRYSLTFLGEFEIEDNISSNDDILDEIRRDYYERGYDFDFVNDVEWEVI